MQIIIPIAGSSDFFPTEQYFFPKPLVDVGGTPMIQRVVENLESIGQARFLFVAMQDEIARFSLDNVFRILAGADTVVLPLKSGTQGALCSALMAVDHLDLDDELVIANSDQVIQANYSEVVNGFRLRNLDAGVITFPSVHPRWSYVDLDNNGLVAQAAEKSVISRDAIAGFYYFRTAKSFVHAAAQCLRHDVRVDGKYYTSLALNEVILSGGRVGARPVDVSDYHSFYTPDKIRVFEDSILRQSIGRKDEGKLMNVVIPAAGEGSRFRQAGFSKAKPFIDVDGQAMVEKVIGNVRPKGADVHVLFRKEHMCSEPEAVAEVQARGATVHVVDRLTEGTACTLLLARTAFDGPGMLLVANSDQYVDFDVDAYVRDCRERELDGSILVFKDVKRDPKWSFARLDNDGFVVEVAEKRPISDLATVGIYLFARGSDFVSAAIDMIACNDRVNGEFYTCPVYNYMIRAGAKIGVYEISNDAMHGLGTPDDLAAFLARG